MHSVFMGHSAASTMFVSSGTDCCYTRLRKCMYSLMCRILASTNSIVESITQSDVYNTSGLRRQWISAIDTL